MIDQLYIDVQETPLIQHTLPREAKTLAEAFEYATVDGLLRLAWIDVDTPHGDTTATALGGILGFNTASLGGFKLHVAAYTSQKLAYLNPSDMHLNPDFFNSEGESFTYMAEAGIDYADDMLHLSAGRIRIDTPYADSDDLRMAPNTFEGAWTDIAFTDTLSTQLYYLSRWAGFDSETEQHRFKPLYDEKSWGGVGGALNYTFLEAHEWSLWYYHADCFSDIIYSELSGKIDFGDAFYAEYGLQGAVLSELEGSGVEGTVIGALALLDYHGLFGGAAFNGAYVTKAHTITDGFGGGPYFTSLDESTIGFISEQAPGEDILAIRLGLGYEFDALGAEGLSIELVRGIFDAQYHKERYYEDDVMLTYDSDAIAFSAIMMHLDIDKTLHKSETIDFTRWVVRADYRF